MNIADLSKRLADLDPEAVPTFVLNQNGYLIQYALDSVAEDGTLVMVPSGIIDSRVSTDGEEVSGEGDWNPVVHEVQDDGS